MIGSYAINILMFPGVILRQVVTLLICQLLRVAIFDVCFFSLFSQPAHGFLKQPGYVIHERPREASHRVLLVAGPLVINSLIGAIIALPAVIPDLEFSAGTPLDYFMMWLGVSIAAQSFPTKEDVLMLAATAKSDELSAAWKALTYPAVVIVYFGVFGKFLSLDLLYGTAVTLILPFLLVAMGR